MYSGGKIISPVNKDNLPDARDNLVELNNERAQLREGATDAREKVAEHEEAYSKKRGEVAEAKSDQRQFETDMRGETKAVQNAEDAEANFRHQLQETRAQLEQQWREWQSSKRLADTMQANFSRKIFSWISQKVAAFFDEYRQRVGEIERVMLALFRKLAAAGNPEISKTSPSATSTDLAFATYVYLSDGVPQNDAISQIERVKAEYDQLIERGKTLAEREADPFYKDKINEAIGRLEEAKSMLEQAEKTLKIAESAEKATKTAWKGALKVARVENKKVTDKEGDIQAQQSGVEKFTDEQRREALERQQNQQNT